MQALRCGLAVVGLALGTGEVRFDPAQGTEVVRRFAYESESSLSSWSVVLNGQEAPAAVLPELRIENREEARAVVRDRVLASAEGRLQGVARAFESLEARQFDDVSLAGEPLEERDERGRSSLEGCEVRFEDGERTLARGEAPEAALAALELDLDFTALLTGAANGAEEWEAPAAALVPMGLPGGIEFEFDDDDEADESETDPWIENLAGAWRVRPLEAREDGRVAVFALEGELSAWIERATELEHVPVADGPATETTSETWKAVGELAWDLERRTLRSLAIEVETTTTVATVRDLQGIPGEPTYEQTLRLVGRSKLTCEVSAP